MEYQREWRAWGNAQADNIAKHVQGTVRPGVTGWRARTQSGKWVKGRAAAQDVFTQRLESKWGKAELKNLQRGRPAAIQEWTKLSGRKKELHKMLCKTTPTRYHAAQMGWSESKMCRKCGQAEETPQHVWECRENEAWKVTQLWVTAQGAKTWSVPPEALWGKLWESDSGWEHQIGMWSSEFIEELSGVVAGTTKKSKREITKQAKWLVSLLTEEAVQHLRRWKIKPDGEEEEIHPTERSKEKLAQLWGEAVAGGWWRGVPRSGFEWKKPTVNKPREETEAIFKQSTERLFPTHVVEEMQYRIQQAREGGVRQATQCWPGEQIVACGADMEWALNMRAIGTWGGKEWGWDTEKERLVHIQCVGVKEHERWRYRQQTQKWWEMWIEGEEVELAGWQSWERRTLPDGEHVLQHKDSLAALSGNREQNVLGMAIWIQTRKGWNEGIAMGVCGEWALTMQKDGTLAGKPLQTLFPRQIRHSAVACPVCDTKGEGECEQCGVRWWTERHHKNIPEWSVEDPTQTNEQIWETKQVGRETRRRWAEQERERQREREAQTRQEGKQRIQTWRKEWLLARRGHEEKETEASEQETWTEFQDRKWQEITGKINHGRPILATYQYGRRDAG